MTKTLKRFTAALIAAVILTILCFSGLLDGADFVISDSLYQKESPTDGDIVIIGMDQYAIDQFGPMPWDRSIIAEAIEYLNNSDPENRPAVIAVDVLYVGNSNPESDDYLCEVCADGGNVVLASAATYGSELVLDGDDFYMDTRSMQAFDAPFGDLYDVTSIGHINAMSDSDGMIRHMMWTIDASDFGYGTVKPFARSIYEMYCENIGTEPMSEPDCNDFFYLPFTGRSGAYYDGVSVADLIEGTVESDYYADKIVLIGPYTMGMQDEYRTSIDHAAPMYGIEIQANQIDAYKNGFFPKEASRLLQLILVFIISAAAVIFFADRKVGTSLLAWIISCAVWIVLCLVLYRKAGVVLHVLWIPLAITLIFIGSVALNYIRAAREKRKVTNTFGRYIDPAIMKELLDEGSATETLGGKNFNIACLFVDIRGFTTMSESLDPPTVVEIINKYLTLTTECIMRHHGTLDKFVGDCTMAFWNAPVAQEDPIYLACCAAMDMVKGSEALAKELQERFGRSVSFGIGVHYGPAVVGNIGAPQRMDFTAIGDTVNTASRLESNAPAGTVYISRVVADALGDRAKTTSLGGSIKLKGKAEGFEILTLDHLDM